MKGASRTSERKREHEKEEDGEGRGGGSREGRKEWETAYQADKRRETRLTRLLINYPPRSLCRYNKMISGRLYRDSGCERPSRHKVAACAPAAVVINNAARPERRRSGRVYTVLRAVSSHTTGGLPATWLSRASRENQSRRARALNSYMNLLHEAATLASRLYDELARGSSASVFGPRSSILVDSIQNGRIGAFLRSTRS